MSASTPKLSTYPVAALIREAPLTIQEKALLFVIASHRGGKSFAKAPTLWRQAAMGRTSFYLVRDALLERGILVDRQIRGKATIYTIRRKELERLVSASMSASGVPSSGTTPAAGQPTATAATRQTTRAVRRHQKQNSKENNEVSKNKKTPGQRTSAAMDEPARRVRRPRGTEAGVEDGGLIAAKHIPATAASVRSRIAAKRREG